MQDSQIKEIYIVGASGFASEVTQYIEDTNKYKILGYFDINKDEYNKYDFKSPYLGSENDFDFNKGDEIIISISDTKLKSKIYSKLKERGLKFPIFIHNNTFISKNSIIKESTILCPFVTINSNSIIGNNFQANIYSYIAHDCIIGDNVTFAPSVKCNGNVIIDDDVYIGTGVIIHQGKPNKPLKIGKGAVIAAGSVITSSIPEGKTYFGNPAIEFTKENIKRRK